MVHKKMETFFTEKKCGQIYHLMVQGVRRGIAKKNKSVPIFHFRKKDRQKNLTEKQCCFR